MKLNLVLLSIVSLILFSCAIGERVYMQNPDTKVVDIWGGNITAGNIASASAINLEKQRTCKQDFKKQGFIRLPGKPDTE